MPNAHFIDIDALSALAEQLQAGHEEQIARMLAGMFSREELESFLAKAPPPPNADRQKALAQLRQLKRLADSTTFAGERLNALEAMGRIQAKHGITDREI